MIDVCTLCNLVFADSGKNIVSCSIHSHCGGSYQVQDGFIEAIELLQAKGYIVTGYKFPRLDEWETDYKASIVFSPHTIPGTLPPWFKTKDVPEVNAIVLFRNYNPADYAGQITRGAVVLRKWAEKLPPVNTDLERITDRAVAL
ncbi:MAG: hypothetical protein LBI19_10905 [Oscillospiraceae bacterium]|jgi:hypothetical protein|nr:hypothetical protein [Oscillospiraceae bacterium]